MRKYWIAGLVGAACAALTATWLIAQPVAQNAISGNECWNAGQGPGGPTFGFLCINGVRNGTAITVVTGSGAATTTGTQAQGTLMWHTTAPTTWAVTLPNPAFDGEIFRLQTDTTLTTMVSVTATTTPQNQTLSTAFTSQTLTANTAGAAWQFSLSLLQWTRIQ